MKSINEYMNQIKLEVKKILGSKLLVIFMILLALMSVVIPILSTLDLFGPRYYYGGYDGEDLVIDGVTIDSDSILFWEIMQANDARKYLEEQASTDVDDLAIELLDIMIADYVSISQEVKTHEDYRSRIIWGRRENIIDVFILENIDVSAEDMQKALSRTNFYHRDLDSIVKYYYDLTDTEKAEKLQGAKDALVLSDKIILTGDHGAYFEYMKNQAEEELLRTQAEIERLQQEIVANPENEELFNRQIEDMKKQMETHDTITMPILEYRTANDIIPGSDNWRDMALNFKESALMELHYNSEIKSRQEYEEDQYLKWEYKTYEAYKESIEKRIEDATNRLLVADKSLETGKPDMEYVQDGTRKKVTNFLWYSLLIAVFATIFAGGLMAREFQSGTIRLLLIRPKGRGKIALSKFFALILICAALYALCIVLNLVTNGILFGFSDLGYPNYTISAGVSGVSFFAFIVPKFLACFVVILFGACVAYFLSILTRNTALSVSIPLVSFAGSLIAMSIIGYSQKFKWIIYTPLPYVNMPQLLTGSYYSPTGIEPIIGYGIGLLLVLGLISVIAGTIILKKRDITN